MTVLTWCALFLSLTALCTSTGALIVTRRSLALCRSTKSAQLSAQLAEQAEELERLTIQVRNLRSRLNMQAYREKHQTTSDRDLAATTEPTDPDAENARIRAELNGRLARGELKIGP